MHIIIFLNLLPAQIQHKLFSYTCGWMFMTLQEIFVIVCALASFLKTGQKENKPYVVQRKQKSKTLGTSFQSYIVFLQTSRKQKENILNVVQGN